MESPRFHVQNGSHFNKHIPPEDVGSGLELTLAQQFCAATWKKISTEKKETDTQTQTHTHTHRKNIKISEKNHSKNKHVPLFPTFSVICLSFFWGKRHDISQYHYVLKLQYFKSLRPWVTFQHISTLPPTWDDTSVHAEQVWCFQLSTSQEDDARHEEQQFLRGCYMIPPKNLYT